MGNFNSSTYRVRPLAKEIEKDTRNLLALLKLVELDGKPSITNIEINEIIEMFYSEGQSINGPGKKEKALRPPQEHLIWMVQNFNLCKKDSGQSEMTKIHRDLLRRGDPVQISKAGSLIKNTYSDGAGLPSSWYILEGTSNPDLFIETDELLIVIEAKWTEPTITSSTTYLEHRSQMVRHIQGALEYNRTSCENKKTVIGFYIVDDVKFVLKNKQLMSLRGFSGELQKETVPIANKQEIIDCYKGYTTWQKIQEDPAFKNVVFLQKNIIEEGVFNATT